MEKVKIAVIGSYAVGMTIYGDHFPSPGETVPGYNFFTCHGGKGSNQAVAAARAGADVLYGTCIGNDDFGNAALELFKEEGIDSRFVRRSTTGKATGVGVVLVNKDGENEIVNDFAANREYSPLDIDNAMPELKKCKLLLMQLECSVETVEYAAKKCEAQGIPFVLNPAPFSPLSDELLHRCTFLTPNQTEARQILGLKADDLREDGEIADMLYKKGVKNVIMTLGSEGCYIRNHTIDKKIPGIQVKSVDTTGAGDVFTGAFCVAIAEGKSIEEAVRFGNAAGGLAVTKNGVIEAVPYRTEIETAME